VLGQLLNYLLTLLFIWFADVLHLIPELEIASSSSDFGQAGEELPGMRPACVMSEAGRLDSMETSDSNLNLANANNTHTSAAAQSHLHHGK
jgi:hypothetical protein